MFFEQRKFHQYYKDKTMSIDFASGRALEQACRYVLLGWNKLDRHRLIRIFDNFDLLQTKSLSRMVHCVLLEQGQIGLERSASWVQVLAYLKIAQARVQRLRLFPTMSRWGFARLEICPKKNYMTRFWSQRFYTLKTHTSGLFSLTRNSINTTNS